MALHLSVVALLCYFATHETQRAMTGTSAITVRLISSAQLAAETHPPTQTAAKPAPAPKKMLAKAVVAIPHKQPPAQTPSLATKPSTATATSATPSSQSQQQVSEANTGNHGATVLYQPMPKIPDDLRREAFNTFATARFHVAEDGSATAELLTPSQNPRLNHLLLEALKTWRFTPATDNGHPIASTFDIRVRFAVE